jgi:predicted metal-dependent enzyme (double-stranded beta helix superfamily)
MPFVLEDFIDDCKKAVASSSTQEEIRAILAEGIFEPSQVLAELGTPTEGGLNTLYHAEDLTILNIIWAPEMTLHAHNHCMWANIGIYGGREENNFYQNTPGGLVQHGQTVLVEKQVSPLHEDVIHSVHNPLSKLTAAIHVYGGDFFEAPRSEWDPETFLEQPFDIEHTRAVFTEANQRMKEL